MARMLIDQALASIKSGSRIFIQGMFLKTTNKRSTLDDFMFLPFDND
jgi:hypothetical protein